MSPTIALPYGKREIRARLSRRPAMLRARGVRRARDPVGTVRRALERPSASPPLPTVARWPSEGRARGHCVVVVSDHTRETALRDVLPAVFGALGEAGAPRKRTSILVAYGNHERVSDRRISALTGPLPRGVSLLHHDSSSTGDLVGIGRLPSGGTLKLNRRAVEAGTLVVTGAVTFHYHAGLTGGRKAFLPGLAGREKVLPNHARTLDARAPWGRDARCAPGRLRGNPVHEEMDAAAQVLVIHRERKGLAPPFLVNVVLSQEGGLAAAFAGDVFEAFEAAAAWVDARFRVKLARPFDMAVASAGGSPRDGTFYQAHKAFDHAARAVRDGGVVILAAECPGGAGKGFLEWFGHESHDEHLAALRKGFAVPGQTALALRQKLARVRGVLVSRMKRADVRAMGLLPARDLDEALDIGRGLVETGGRARACVIPHASTTLPGPGPRRKRRRAGERA